MLIKLFVQTLQKTETIILDLFFAIETMKKPPSKVGHFSKMDEIF